MFLCLHLWGTPHAYVTFASQPLSEVCTPIQGFFYPCHVSWKCLSGFCSRILICTLAVCQADFYQFGKKKKNWLKCKKVSGQFGPWSLGSILVGCGKGRHYGLFVAKEITSRLVRGKRDKAGPGFYYPLGESAFRHLIAFQWVSSAKGLTTS